MRWGFTKKDLGFLKNKIFAVDERIKKAHPGYANMESLQRERRLYVWMLEQLSGPQQHLRVDSTENKSSITRDVIDKY